MALVPTIGELIDLFKQRMFCSKMARRFGVSDESDVNKIVDLCAYLHNEGTLDLLQLVDAGDLQALADTSFFMATHYFCQILPELNVPPKRMMSCIEALVTRGGKDGMANAPHDALRIWCGKDDRRAREIIGAALGGDDLSTRYLAFALESINDIAESRNIAFSTNGAHRMSAITALGRIHDDDAHSIAKTFAVFDKCLDLGDHIPIRSLPYFKARRFLRTLLLSVPPTPAP